MCEKPRWGHGPTGDFFPDGGLLLVKDEGAEGPRAIVAICLRQFIVAYGGLRRFIRWVSYR